MSKKLKGIYIAVIISLVVVALLAGCKPAGTKETGGAATGDDLSTKYEISYLGSWMADTEDDNYVESYIQEALNIEITPVATQNSGEQLSILISTNSLPDCMWLYGPDPAEFYYKQELVRTIPRSMLEQYAPGFVELYSRYPVLWAQALLKDSDDELVALTGISESLTEKLYLYSDYMRYDWIENLDLDIGTEVEKIEDNFYLAKSGIKLDNYKKILDAFVNDDPDGNGENDTIGCVSVNDMTYLPGFGLGKTDVMVGDQVEMYYVTEDYREYLKYMSELYAEKLLDQEVFTQDRNAAWEKINKGIGGVWTSSTNALNDWAVDRPPLTLMATDPEAKILMYPGLATNTGEFGTNGFESPASGWFYVNRTVEDEGKLARILQFAQFACFGNGDDTVIATMLHAEEGVNWEMEEGAPKIIGEPLLQGSRGTWSYGIEFLEADKCWDWITLQPLFNKGAAYYVSKDGMWNKHMKTPMRFDPLNETDIIEVRSEVQTSINDTIATFTNNIIMGIKELNDVTWQEYLDELDTMGYQRLIDEIRKMQPYDELIAQFQ